MASGDPLRREVGGWLSGPPGMSPPGLGRRVVALFVDWFAAIGVTGLVSAALLGGRLRYGAPDFSLVVLAVFAGQTWALTWLAGASFGHRLLGLQVVGADGRPIGPLRALLRTVLLCLVVPALIWDRQGRGLHDRAARSYVVRVTP